MFQILNDQNENLFNRRIMKIQASTAEIDIVSRFTAQKSRFCDSNYRISLEIEE